MSHAGCYVTIVGWAAKKMRLTLRGCDVKVEAVEDEETGVITEEAFDITLKVDAPMDRVQRLHEVTLKNCPVGMLFERAGVKTTYKLRAQKE
jgi:putative redox protein